MENEAIKPEKNEVALQFLFCDEQIGCKPLGRDCLIKTMR